MLNVIENRADNLNPDILNPDHVIQTPLHCVFFEEDVPLDKNRFADKGVGLMEMTRLGLPVPPGFIIPIDLWRDWRENDNSLPASAWSTIVDGIEQLEQKTGTRFGDPEYPLFVSVRSGSPRSMPGMLNTLLNIGLNEETVGALAKIVGQEEAEKMLASIPAERPKDPQEQIRWAISEVFDSWNNQKARLYRQKLGISEQFGTAAIVEKMVWGNSQADGAGTGVVLTRDPQTYGDHPVIAYAEHAQGPSVVTNHYNSPLIPISELPIPDNQKQQFENNVQLLEQSNKLVPQDVEITSDGEKIWFLQTRNEQLSPLANLRSLLHRIKEGYLTKHEAMCSIPSAHINALLQPTLDLEALKNVEMLAEGIPTSIGIQTGRLYFSLQQVQNAVDQENIILCNPNVESITQIPSNVVAVLLPNAGVGSHIAVEATRMSKDRMFIPVFGVTIDPEYAGKIVTVDAGSDYGGMARIYLGAIPFADFQVGSSLFSSDERNTAQTWMTQKEKNPWRFLNSKNGIEEYEHTIREALEQIKNNNIRSKKAQEYFVFNAAIPEEIRQPYTIVPVDTFDSMVHTIEPMLAHIFANGNHATIRTCHDPAIDAGGPWALIRDMEGFQHFLHDSTYSKYGSFQEFLDNPNLTELLVGDIPPGKMEDDNQAIQHQFAAWTLSCMENGIVVLQIHPHNAHLRKFEKAKKEKVEMFTAHFDPTTPNQLSDVSMDINERLKDDEVGLTLAEITRKTVFEKWWKEYELPQRMAAIASVLGINPVFEGQAHTNGLCLGYGIKTK